jgi:hypothetical protein
VTILITGICLLARQPGLSIIGIDNLMRPGSEGPSAWKSCSAGLPSTPATIPTGSNGADFEA